MKICQIDIFDDAEFLYIGIVCISIFYLFLTYNLNVFKQLSKAAIVVV